MIARFHQWLDDHETEKFIFLLFVACVFSLGMSFGLEGRNPYLIGAAMAWVIFWLVTRIRHVRGW